MKSLTWTCPVVGLFFASLGFGGIVNPCTELASPTHAINYSDLVNLGSDGCSVGDAVFSDFWISGDLTGADVNIAQVIDTPSVAGFEFEFNLGVGWPASGIISDSFAIGYLIETVGGLPLISSGHLGMEYAVSGSALASVDETFCAGALEPTCTNGHLYELTTSEGGTGPHSSDGVSFAPVSQIYLSKSIFVAAGRGGLANISTLTETVGEVPEPGTFVLIGLTLVGLRMARRRA